MISKNVPVIIGTMLLVGATIFGATQYGKVVNQQKDLAKKEGDIKYLEETLESEIKDNVVLEKENTLLSKKIKELQAIIGKLQSEIKSLESKVKSQKKKIASYDAKLKQIEKDYNSLKKQISEITRSGKSSKAQIVQLENEKALLRKKVEELHQEKEKQLVVTKQTEAEILDKQVSEAKFKRLTSIVNNTSIRFQSITGRKSRFGRPITKVKKKNWQYTIIEFFLEHNDMNLLLDEKFILKVVNTDTKEVLSYIESNPNFPNSDKDSKGIQFKFDGNLVEIAHYNNQQKKKGNYELQVLYLNEDGEEYQLLNGVRAITKDGKFID